MQELWNTVDDYLAGLLAPSDDALDAALAATTAAGMPEIQVSPVLGKLLHLLARLCSARRILEIGTLGGYSTIWLARALPADGRLVTLELSPEHAAVARENIARAGLADRVEVLVGPALESLAALAAAGGEPCDLVFIDADKQSTAQYIELALQLTRPGSLIVVDNAVRHGQIVETGGDASVQGMRRALELLSSDPRLDATALQTVGVKGYDGFAVALVK